MKQPEKWSSAERAEKMSSSRILRKNAPGEFCVTPYAMQEVYSRDQQLAETEQAHKQAQAILNQARSQRETIEMEAYNQGLQQGRTQGQKIAIKKIEPLFDSLHEAIEGLSHVRQQLTAIHSKHLLKIIILIAQRVIHREIHLAPDIILDTIKAAGDKLMDTDEIRLRLHPSDYEYIREAESILTKQLSGKKNIQIIEDTSIERGGALVETEFGDIDATIRSQIEYISEALLEHD